MPLKKSAGKEAKAMIMLDINTLRAERQLNREILDALKTLVYVTGFKYKGQPALLAAKKVIEKATKYYAINKNTGETIFSPQKKTKPNS